MKSVYADKSLGISQNDKFDIPSDFDPCDSELEDLEWADEDEEYVEVDEAFQ
jgi:hypothetical protein